MVFIPFEVSIEEHGSEKDPTKHITERELPGVARWALEGALKIFKLSTPRGLPMSERGMAWVKRCYYTDSPFTSFLIDCKVVESKEEKYTLTGLYSLFERWFREVNDPHGHEEPMKKDMFDRAVRSEFDTVYNKKTRHSADQLGQNINSWWGVAVNFPEGARAVSVNDQTSYLMS